ncbi:hypothetical protein LXM26_14195 [Dyadobacter sp. LJ419]|uniref:Uncharacterized protein n=1 Tax=Dyadobacter chenwenxiniae TaxID=2906456 RepID=A0A9X1PMG6_9BACT|nr:hypothetical protein [Dyadobacter chenwenxiniae]MCF0062654.1 hypothetical protein [Dyadobacter chenwenxiniae]
MLVFNAQAMFPELVGLCHYRNEQHLLQPRQPGASRDAAFDFGRSCIVDLQGSKFLA